MAKVKCPECGKKYEGNFCPNCSAAAPKEGKKKWLLPAVIVVAVVFLIAGMGGGEEIERPASVQGDSSVQNNSDAAHNDVNGGNGAGDSEAGQAAPAERVTIVETELYNANGIAVTATAMGSGIFGPEISVTVSNNTERNVVVSTRNLSVNGYMLSTSGLYSEIAANKKAVAAMSFMSSELAEAGIETIADIEFNLAIYDYDTFEDIDNTALIKLSASGAEGFVQPVDDSGDVIYNDHGVRVVCKGLKDDSVWDGCVVFYVENNNDEYVSVYSENVSVNGFMVDESFWSDLRPNTRSVEGMYLWTLENVGIESIDEVKNIEFTLRVIDEEWADIATTDVISLNFN